MMKGEEESGQGAFHGGRSLFPDPQVISHKYNPLFSPNSGHTYWVHTHSVCTILYLSWRPLDDYGRLLP